MLSLSPLVSRWAGLELAETAEGPGMWSGVLRDFWEVGWDHPGIGESSGVLRDLVERVPVWTLFKKINPTQTEEKISSILNPDSRPTLFISMGG